MAREFVSAIYMGLAIAAVGVACARGADPGIADENDSGDRQSVPLPSSPESDAGRAATRHDAGGGSGDAATVAVGASCTDPAGVYDAPCGSCGTKSALCIVPAGSTVGRVSEYGECKNEPPGACAVGTTRSCGNCGTQTCTNNCVWDTCAGEGACAPSAVEYSQATCATGQVAKRACTASCTWSSYSACSAPVNDTVLDISGSILGNAIATVDLSSTQMAPRLVPLKAQSVATCPSTALSSTADHPYRYVEVKNPTPLNALVTIYNSQAPGGGTRDTIMAVYPTAVAPSTDAERRACGWGVGDQSSDPADAALTGFPAFAIVRNVPILSGSSVLVYVSTAFPYAANPTGTLGAVSLNVRTEQLQ